MQKQCKKCSAQYEITQEDLDFYDKISPVFNGVKYPIPSPTHCPSCRMQRRMSVRVFFSLYKRRCSATGKSIISMFDENAPFPIYNQKEWWADRWDPLDYGKEIDFEKSFFDQGESMSKFIPKQSIISINCENSDYCNLSFDSKDCYLVFGCVDNEKCYYGHIVWHSNNCIDCLYTYKSEYCYQCIDCINSYNVSYSRNIENCSNSKFLNNCVNCKDCFGCVGLNNKSFCIFNKQYSEDEYKKLMSEYNLGKNTEIKAIDKKVLELTKNSIVKSYHGSNCIESSGDYLYNCNKAINSYDAKGCENIKNCATVGELSNCYDMNFSPMRSEYSYEGLAISGNKVLFSYDCLNNCSDLLYCKNCYYCSNCFLCEGLIHKSYCILNKQYSKEEYKRLVPQIIEHMKKAGEWGEFFPTELSSFAYNETVAQEYFPMTKEEVESKGWKWKDEEDQINDVVKIIPPEKLPDDIIDIPDDILNWAIRCEISGRPFKIIPQELAFYREYKIPIPHLHPDERHKERMKLRNPRQLFDRQCMKCSKGMQSTYAPDRPEIIYCEECYLKEVY